MRTLIAAALAAALGAAGCGGPAATSPPTRQLEPGRGIAKPGGGRMPFTAPAKADKGGK
jgi:ABC-type glycerol-3-phosphate transport system substrate-binding protein